MYIERSVGDVDRAVQCGGTGRVRGRERKEEAASVWWGVCVRRALDGREHRAVCRTSRNGKACRGPRGPERRGRSRGASYSVVRAGRNSEAQRSERHGAGVRCVQCLQGEHSREFPNLLSVSCPPIALEIKWAVESEFRYLSKTHARIIIPYLVSSLVAKEPADQSGERGHVHTSSIAECLKQSKVPETKSQKQGVLKLPQSTRARPNAALGRRSRSSRTSAG